MSGKLTAYMEAHDGSPMDNWSMRAGDFLGDFALLGDPDWGSSTLINLPLINLEASTSPHNFAVCLILETVTR